MIHKKLDKEYIDRVIECFMFLSPERTQDIVAELLDIIIEHVDIESLSEDEFKAFENAHYMYITPGDDIHEDTKIFNWVLNILKSLPAGDDPDPVIYNPDFDPDCKGLDFD